MFDNDEFYGYSQSDDIDEDDDGYVFNSDTGQWIEKNPIPPVVHHMSSYGPAGAPITRTRPDSIADLMNAQLQRSFDEQAARGDLTVQVEASPRLMKWGERSAILAGFFLSKWLSWFFLFRWLGMFFLKRAYFFAGGKVPVIRRDGDAPSEIWR